MVEINVEKQIHNVWYLRLYDTHLHLARGLFQRFVKPGLKEDKQQGMGCVTIGSKEYTIHGRHEQVGRYTYVEAMFKKKE